MMKTLLAAAFLASPAVDHGQRGRPRNTKFRHRKA